MAIRFCDTIANWLLFLVIDTNSTRNRTISRPNQNNDSASVDTIVIIIVTVFGSTVAVVLISICVLFCTKKTISFIQSTKTIPHELVSIF